MRDIALKLIDEYQITKINPTNIYFLSGYKGIDKFFISTVGIKRLMSYGADPVKLIENPEKIYNSIANEMRSELHKAPVKAKTNLPDSDLAFSEFILMTDIKTADMLLFNTVSERLSPVCPDALMLPMDAEDKAWFMESMRYCEFKYEPYSLEKYRMGALHGKDFMTLNSHIPPEWRLLPNPTEAPKCPEIIEKLLKHLFPKQDSLDYALDWLYTCIQSRNEIYLVLNGAKGVGKGLFASLAIHLLGKENALDAPLSVFRSQFMAALDSNRLVIFDEFKVGKHEHTRLKRLANKFQTIEKKGVDADKAIETFNSFIVSNNDTSDMYLEGDDRRFSVAEISSTRMTDVWSKEDMDKIVSVCEESTEVYGFGHYLLNRGLVTQASFQAFNTHEFRSKHFYTLVYTSLAEWQRFLVDYLLESDQEEEDLTEIRKAFTKEFKELKFPRKFSKIGDFLTNYRHEGIKSLGKLCRENRELFIKLTIDEELDYL